MYTPEQRKKARLVRRLQSWFPLVGIAILVMVIGLAGNLERLDQVNGTVTPYNLTMTK